MNLDVIFQWANSLALLGWVFLVIGLFIPVRFTLKLGLTLPILLSALYFALALVYFWDMQGGFDSLSNVMALFTQPELVLIGWVHYLAFDLFVGWCIARDSREQGISRWLVIPALFMTFLLGPVGLILYLIFRLSNRWSQPSVVEAQA